MTLQGAWEAVNHQVLSTAEAPSRSAPAQEQQSSQASEELAFRGEVVELAGAKLADSLPQAKPSVPDGPAAGVTAEKALGQTGQQTSGQDNPSGDAPQPEPARDDRSKVRTQDVPMRAAPQGVRIVDSASQSRPAAESPASLTPPPAPRTSPEASRPVAPPPAPGAGARAAASAPIEQPQVDNQSTESVHSLEFKISERNAPAVSLHVNDRGGRIEVAVRSADSALTQQLQSQLSSLTEKLETRGLAMENIRTVESKHSGDLSQGFNREQRGQDSQGHSMWHKDSQPTPQGQPQSGRDRGLFRWADEVDEEPATSRKGR